MDFLDPKKKRSHRTRLFIGYGLMAILIGISALILLFEASGFDVDRRTGAIIHNGLVFVDSHPESAEVYLDNKHQGSTDMRLVIPEGQYEIELKRDGYRSWKRRFTIEGSQIERFVYPFLFPAQLSSETMLTYEQTPRLATQSPDRKWLVLQRSANLNELEVVNLSSETAESRALILPSGILTAAAGDHSLEMVEWSTDNRHVLLKHTYVGGAEFIMLDHNTPQASLNLNRHFTIPFTQVSLRDKRFDRLYLLHEPTGLLSEAEVGSRLASPLLGKVLAFRSHGASVLMYITSDGATEGRVAVRLREADQTYTLREISADSKYLLDLARYDGSWFMAAGSPKDQRVYIYRDAFEVLKRPNEILRVPVPAAVLKMDGAEFISISANAKFFAVQAGSRLLVYDVEKDRQFRYDSQLKLAAGQKIRWMDGHRFMIVNEGKVVIFDYDGINNQTLVSARDGFLPFFDRDYRQLFTLSSAEDPARTNLVRTKG